MGGLFAPAGTPIIAVCRKAAFRVSWKSLVAVSQAG